MNSGTHTTQVGLMADAGAQSDQTRPIGPQQQAHHIVEPSLHADTKQILDKSNSKPEQDFGPQQKEPGLLSALTKFITDKGIQITTFVSSALNIISAPIRALNIESPLKKWINHASMLASKTHLLTYAFSGLEAAIRDKNLLLITSFLIEGFSAVFSNVRNLYLMRGIATALDQLPGAFADHSLGGRNFDSYFGGLMKSFSAWGKILSEFIQDPSIALREQKGHMLGVSSVFMIIGSLFGLGVNDKIGGSIRDLFGALGDIGLTRTRHRDAQIGGWSYLFGSFFDFIARFFSSTTAKMFSGTRDIGKTFEGMRNAFHEIAIALDRFGQFFFLRFLQDDSKPTEAESAYEEPVEDHWQEVEAS